MPPRLTNAQLEALVRELGQLRKQPGAQETQELLERALASKSPHAALKAVEIVAEQRLPGFAPRLLPLYARAFDNGAKRDPGCRLKVAVAEVLDFEDHDDPEPFERGLSYVQPEASWGKPEDTAGPLRARCGLALVRLRHPRSLDFLADLLSDPDEVVRATAARAVAYHGDEKGCALLRLKLHHSDPEPDVLTEVLKAYLALDPGQALAFAERLLERGSGPARGALLALGESRLPQALPLIAGFLELATAERDLQAASLALANLREPAATAHLLDALAAGSEARATAALEALSLLAADPQVAADIRAAEARNPETSLARVIERLIPAAP